MPRRTPLLLLTMLLALTLVGCGPKSTPAATTGAAAPTVSAGVALDANGCPTDNTVTLAKTKFILHAGLAFGTFHRYFYKPFKAGTFSKGAKGRLSALAKGAATAVFDVHEIKLAETDVKADPALCRKIIVPLQKLATSFDGLKSKLTGGDTSDLDADNAMATMVEQDSSSTGTNITESTDESAG